MSHLRTRFLVICLVALLSVGLFVKRGLNLGLDLRGGVHLVLNVMTDDAVRAETDRESQRLGTEAPAMEPAAEARIRNDAVEQVMRIIQNRLDKLGVGEVSLGRYGAVTDYQIYADIPGMDLERAVSIIQVTAQLELKLVESGPYDSRDALLEANHGVIPANSDVLSDASSRFYLVQKVASVSGTDLKNAFVSRDENGHAAVGFLLTAAGAQRFGDVTEQNIGRPLAVVLDGRIQSVARIETRITDSGVIRGGGAGFKPSEAADLALMLKSGALPAGIQIGEELGVGPSLGADSIRRGITTSIVALAAVLSFMLFYYRSAGVNAAIAMIMNLMMLVGAMAYFQAVLTLPGIAGIVLTIGVGIDSNVLVFERIREELKAGKTAVLAMRTAFQRVFVTLLDTHFAALISAAFLFVFGTGTIKGFAVTLVIGLVANLFTSVFVSRTLFEWTLGRS